MTGTAHWRVHIDVAGQLQHLARFKVPKVVELSASLPREDSGKIFKRKLCSPYWENAGRSI